MPPKESKRGNQLKGWSVTMPETAMTKEEIITVFRAVAKRWVFQEEKGEKTGYRHYQCTMELKTRARHTQVLQFFGPKSGNVHIRATSSKDGAWDYSKKGETRVAGPWSSEDKEEVKAETPDDLKEVKLRPWQAEVEAILTAKADAVRSRKVWVIVDPVGDNGKSFLAKYLGWKKIAACLQGGDAKAMGREATSVCEEWKTHPRGWMIDVPRRGAAMLANHAFWCGVEKVKNGIYHDDRHRDRTIYATNPNVVVVTNVPPDWSMLSADRWEPKLLWEGKLYDYSQERYDAAVERYLAKGGAVKRKPADECPLDVPVLKRANAVPGRVILTLLRKK